MSIDQWLLIQINTGLSHPILDQFFLFITDAHKIKWVAWMMILILVTACIRTFGKASWKALVFVIVCVSAADLFCYRVLKANIDRPRPFQSESFQVHVKKVGEAHGNSFPSNHAANSFSGAYALSVLFPHLGALFFTYAAFVAVSRVYLGVHYPSDVVAGAMIGVLIAFLIRFVFRKKLNSLTGRKS